MADKIFCSDCKYFTQHHTTKCFNTYDAENLHERCESPKNIRVDYSDDITNKYISSPSIINRFNNCLWFEKKEEIVVTPDQDSEDTII